MKLIKLSEEEFEQFAQNHEQATFLQTINWAKLKEKNGWNWELLGFKKDKKIICGTMILSKSTILGKKMFYAPRGFLIDYNNTELLNSFTLELKKYLKTKKAIFLKIDPYIMYHQRDIDGKIVPGGIDNSDIVKKLNRLGFNKQCKKPGQQSLQATWMYWLPLENKTLDDILKKMNREKRRIINNNEKNGEVLREGTYDDLVEFKKIMDHTSERRQFINRSLEYYQNMYKSFGNGKYLKLYFVDLHIEEKLTSFKEELKKIEADYDKLVLDVKNGTRKVTENTMNIKKREVTSLKDKITEYEVLFKKHGSILTLGGILYFIYGNEVLAFLGGSYDEFMEFQSSYTIHYEMIKYAIENNFKYYNFYGISSDLTPKDHMYGVYLFKKGFGGEVVELIGEYDLKIDPVFYYIYKFSYFVVHKLKKIKTKIH